MTTRHRYTGFVDGLCGQTFGGVARCHLPLGNIWHYSDSEHPFTPNVDYPEECGWALQSAEGFCAGDITEQMHRLRTDPVPPEGLEPITVTTIVPVQEAPVNKDWQHGNVYPPSDDGGEAQYTAGGRKLNPDGSLPPEQPYSTKAPTEVLKQEADGYRWDGGAVGEKPWPVGEKPWPVTEAPTMVINTGDEQPEWSRAVGWLQEPGVGLTYGPWPVRKYILPDLAAEDREGALYRTHYGAFEAAMVGLDALDQDYALVVRRLEGASYRTALLTWDWALGLEIEPVCDELAALYG